MTKSQNANRKEPAAQDLLDWYDRHHRTLPWRISPKDREQGAVADPYHVWLSEIMLQQTTVGAVKSYFEKFLLLWPHLSDLAAAKEEDVLKAWAGLGYYSRARNLKKCADHVYLHHNGRFPETAKALKDLPGIGDYTSAAIASIAFDEAVPVVDGNIERIVSRLYRIEEALPKAKKTIKEKVAAITPSLRPGDFAQGMMDLGASLCSPKKPACALCPYRGACEAQAKGDQERFPIKAPKKQKPTRYGAAFLIKRQSDGAIWLCQRPDKGLLASMSEVPGTDWTGKKAETFDLATAPQYAPENMIFQKQLGQVTHTFTHFHLILDVYEASTNLEKPLKSGWWSDPNSIANEALPTVFKKVLEVGGTGKNA